MRDPEARLSEGTRLVLAKLRARRREVTCRELAADLDWDDWGLLGFNVDYLRRGGPRGVPPAGLPSHAPMRVAGRLRHLSSVGLAGQRIEVRETRTGGLDPVRLWWAAPRRRYDSRRG